MKTFNKSLIAAVVASMSTYAAADIGDFTDANAPFTGDQKVSWVSAEGVATGNTSVVHDGGSFAFDNSTAMAQTARFLITVSGAKFALDANAAFDSGNAIADIVPTEGTASLSNSQLTSLTTLSVPVDLTGATLTAEADTVLTFAGLKLDMSDAVEGSKVTVKIEAQKELSSTVYATIDTVSGTLAEVVKQLGVKVDDKADKKITAADRLTFTTGANATEKLQDEFGITLVDNNVQYAEVTGQNDYTVSMESDFSFLDQDGDEKVDSGVTVTATNGTLAFAKDFQSLTIKAAAAGINGDGSGISEGLSFTFDKVREIPQLNADATVAYTYKGTASPTTADFSDTASNVISWSLEGTPGSFSYMPYGDNISQILFVTNNESNDADITVSAFDKDGTPYGPVKLDVQAKGKAVTKITGAVEEALIAEGFSGSGSLSLNITVNSGDVDYYGAYNVGGSDRGYVQAK